MSSAKYVLLDRDGVINQDSDDYIKSPEEWNPIEGSLEAIALLNRHGYKVVVVTNQSGLRRGLFNRETLDRIHAKMRAMVASKGGAIEAIYLCPHGPDEGCDCRKPKTGLLTAFSREKKSPLKNMYFIGDSFKDVQAGLAVGASPLLVKTGKGEKTLAEHPELDIPVFENLHEAAQFIVSRQ
ncbi:MAG: D-glycero-beta-D-manno-heptose 1,7-bisphosphate 7-phosphatase [Gammaproteobacteria bacterium]